MRKSLKSQLLDILGTLSEANSILETSPDKALIQDVLRQGFDAVLNCIEQESSKESLPNQLCTKEQMEAEICGENTQNIQQFITLLNQYIEQLPEQYKVVFFPYLENTWDSMESVYMAFSADERFITDIIIIPAHRNSPAGRVSLYQDFLTPKGIPHTLYQHYDLEVDQPDIAIVNNPYDSVVDAPYYAKDIRAHCRMMIYLPYYGLMSSQYQYNDYSLYALPTQILADWIIVQNARLVQSYNQYCTGLKNRYQPLGTPKTDALLAKKELVSNQKIWNDKIKNRKVCMLNTHYNIANDSCNYENRIFYPVIELIGALLEYFSQRNDLFFIWRPHPLTDTMINGKYYPEHVIKEYLTYYQRAEAMENVILDRQSDSNIAMFLADVMISQVSSMAPLFCTFGKPLIMDKLYFTFCKDGDSTIEYKDIAYYPESQWLVALLRLRLAGGNPDKVAAWKSAEEKALSTVDSEIADEYHSVVSNVRGYKIFNDKFAEIEKKSTKHPLYGYSQMELINENNSSWLLLSEEKENEVQRFVANLLRAHGIAEVVERLDSVLGGDDPLRDAHAKAFQDAVANGDGSCGDKVHQFIAGQFLEGVHKHNCP